MKNEMYWAWGAVVVVVFTILFNLMLESYLSYLPTLSIFASLILAFVFGSALMFFFKDQHKRGAKAVSGKSSRKR